VVAWQGRQVARVAQHGMAVQVWPLKRAGGVQGLQAAVGSGEVRCCWLPRVPPEARDTRS